MPLTTNAHYVDRLSADEDVTTTRIALPVLRPPSDGLIALLRICPMAELHKPLPLELIIRNLHPNRTATPSIVLELEPTDSFVVAGLRSGRLPTLLPGAETRLVWQLIPLECGPAVALPKIRVVDKRNFAAAGDGTAGPSVDPEADGEEVRIVDVRWDVRWSDGTEALHSPRAATNFSRSASRGDAEGYPNPLPLRNTIAVSSSSY